MYETWTNVAKIVAALAAVAFALVYGVTAPWWKRAVSRNVMALMSAIGLFLVLGLIQMVNPNAFDSWPWIRPVVWTIIAGLLVQRFVILLREQVLRRCDGHRASSERTEE